MFSMIGIGATTISISMQYNSYSFSTYALDTSWNSLMITKDTGFSVELSAGQNYTIQTWTVFDDDVAIKISESNLMLTGLMVDKIGSADEQLIFKPNNTKIYYILIDIKGSPVGHFTFRVLTGGSGANSAPVQEFKEYGRLIYNYIPFFILTAIGIISFIFINIAAETIKIQKSSKTAKPFTRPKKFYYSPVQSPTEVSIKRQFEYLSGFVRVKVKIINQSNYTISRVRFELDIPESLVLRKIEPAYKIEGDEVQLADLPPNSSKTMGFTLEPLICGKEKLYGNLEYLDYRGSHKVMTMMPLELEIICPLFFTEEDANIATLTNLITYKLKKNDERSYALPERLSPDKAFQIVKSVIQIHHVKFVSETVENKSTFEAHAWYYGKSKINLKEFVIQGIVSEKNKCIKIMVDCDDELSLVGFLSELGSDLRKGILREGIIRYEDDLVALRCPSCAAPLDKFPQLGKPFKCSYCNSLVTLE